MKIAKVKLSKFEVETLIFTAGDGYSDGELFTDADGKDTGYGGKKADSAYARAVDKLQAGINLIEDSELKERIQSLHKGESNDLMDKGWNEAIEHITKNVL